MNNQLNETIDTPYYYKDMFYITVYYPGFGSNGDVRTVRQKYGHIEKSNDFWFGTTLIGAYPELRWCVFELTTGLAVTSISFETEEDAIEFIRTQARNQINKWIEEKFTEVEFEKLGRIKQEIKKAYKNTTMIKDSLITYQKLFSSQ